MHVIVPEGFDDPGQPTGGNIYGRRVCAGMAEAGWDVLVTTVAAAWPVPGPGARADLARIVSAIPDGATVLIDGLIASPAAAQLPEKPVVRARQWRLPFSRLACASSTLTASARDTKRGLAGAAHVDSYLQSLGGEICLILPPSERTCRRLSQDVASRETLRNRKVINIKSAR